MVVGALQEQDAWAANARMTIDNAVGGNGQLVVGSGGSKNDSPGGGSPAPLQLPDGVVEQASTRTGARMPMGYTSSGRLESANEPMVVIAAAFIAVGVSVWRNVRALIPALTAFASRSGGYVAAKAGEFVVAVTALANSHPRFQTFVANISFPARSLHKMFDKHKIDFGVTVTKTRNRLRSSRTSFSAIWSIPTL
jgi:hypothetical protein